MSPRLRQLPKPADAPHWSRGLELILLAPALVMLAAGAAAWSAYFWLGHRLQEVADRAARAADHAASEQAGESVARVVAIRELARAGLPPRTVAVFLERRGGRTTLHLAYEARRPTQGDLSRFLPSPPDTIVRVSPVSLGGR